jgi:hypothetical protein
MYVHTANTPKRALSADVVGAEIDDATVVARAAPPTSSLCPPDGLADIAGVFFGSGPVDSLGL